MRERKLMFLVMMVGCLFALCSCVHEEVVEMPEFKDGWYVYEGQTTKYFLYYRGENNITFGGVAEQQFSESTLAVVNRNYSWDKAWENLYKLTGEKITNPQTKEQYKIDDYKVNKPAWMAKELKIEYKLAGEDESHLCHRTVWALAQSYKILDAEWWKVID